MQTRLLFFTIILFTTLGCYRSEVHTVKKAGEIVGFTPPKGTHTVTFKIKGTFSCPTNVKRGINQSEQMFNAITLIGEVDTLIRSDNYDNDLYLLLEPESCVEDLALFKVKFLY